MPAINSLPNETLNSIFQYCSEAEARPPKAKYGTLNSIVRVNRRWHSLALPILYSHIDLADQSRAILFVEAVYERNPSNAAYVNSLHTGRHLPDILESRLAQCTFSKLVQLVMYSKLCAHMHESAMLPENTLEKLDCQGRACQKLVDQHSKSLKTLSLVVNLNTNVAYCGSLPTLPLVRLTSLDMTFQRGTSEAMAELASLLPVVTCLRLVVDSSNLSGVSRDRFRAALECFLHTLGSQLKVLRLSHRQYADWALDHINLGKFSSLQSFTFCGSYMPSWDPAGLRRLPSSLQHISIICETMRIPDLRCLLEMFPGRFPNLVAIPDIEVADLQLFSHDVEDISSKVTAALDSFEQRGLLWKGTDQAYQASIWNLDYDNMQDLSDGGWGIEEQGDDQGEDNWEELDQVQGAGA